MAKFFIGQFTMVLRHPPNTSLENNFANDKGTHKLCSHIILSHPMIRLCVQKIRWLVVEELISHYFSSGWMLVMKGFSYLIENVCGKVEQFILMESNLDIEFWLESWKEHYVDKVRQILPEKIYCGWSEANFKIFLMMMMTIIVIMKMMMMMVMVTTDVKWTKVFN